MALSLLALVLWFVGTVLTGVASGLGAVGNALGRIIGPIDDWVEQRIRSPFLAWLTRLAVVIGVFLAIMSTVAVMAMMWGR